LRECEGDFPSAMRSAAAAIKIKIAMVTMIKKRGGVLFIYKILNVSFKEHGRLRSLCKEKKGWERFYS
jgi:hypothetical protein